MSSRAGASKVSVFGPGVGASSLPPQVTSNHKQHSVAMLENVIFLLFICKTRFFIF